MKPTEQCILAGRLAYYEHRYTIAPPSYEPKTASPRDLWTAVAEAIINEYEKEQDEKRSQPTKP